MLDHKRLQKFGATKWVTTLISLIDLVSRSLADHTQHARAVGVCCNRLELPV